MLPIRLSVEVKDICNRNEFAQSLDKGGIIVLLFHIYMSELDKSAGLVCRKVRLSLMVV